MISVILLSIHALVVGAFLVRVLWRDDITAPARLAWFIVLLVLPYLGAVVYLLFGEISLGRTIHNRHSEVFRQLHLGGKDFVGNCDRVLSDRVERQYHAAFRTASSVDGLETTDGNTGQLMLTAKGARDRLVQDIDRATDHVHVLYYIWMTDETGTNVANALIRAAKRGVTCKAMADALGSRELVRSALWNEMTQAGVDTQIALPIKGILRTILFSRLDLRNHRKITIIDGKVTYCGSQNCADSMIRTKPGFSPWIDIMVRLEGPVVAQNQLLFASDWMLHRSDASIGEFPLFSDQEPGGFPAQVFADGPTGAQGATPQLFSVLIGQAQSTLTISTPYFVPDPVVLNALLAAARRGVKVTLVFPRKNDSWIVAAASRSFYRRLLESGLEIFEYTDGLLHAKTLTIDSAVSFIGSTNIDLRSFDLNYENDIILRDDTLTKAIEGRQREYIACAVPVTLEAVLGWSPVRRVWNNVVATMGPVL